ncbi:unnamed protein product [Peronospora effusa]|nr:unnamed protein product [Peronospora effusa]
MINELVSKCTSVDARQFIRSAVQQIVWARLTTARTKKAQDAGGSVDLAMSKSISGKSDANSIVEAMNKQQQPVSCQCNDPSWRDSSTTHYCIELGLLLVTDRVADISESQTYERFTGNQIAKRIQEDPAFLETYGRIALMPSMLTSLLCGNYISIDDTF